MPKVSSASSSNPSWSRPWFFPLLIVLATIAVYGNTLRVPFVFDDAGAVVNNASIRQLWPLSVPLTPPPDGSTATGRPVLNLSYALNYAISGLDGWSYHATNLLLHALAALTLFGLVRRTLHRLAREIAPNPVCNIIRCKQAGVLEADWLAGWLALLWAVHPLLTETVSSVAQRTEGLFALFYLLTLYGFVRGAESERPRGWFAFSIAACLIGMGSKEVMVSAPLMVLLYDRTFVAGTFGGALRRRAGYYAGLAATWLLLAWILLGAGGSRGVSAGFGLGVTPWSYLLTQCEALIIYLKLCLWPHPLVVDYGMAVVTSAADVFFQGIALLALAAGTLWALWKRPGLGFVGAWFFVILAPSSSVVPLVAQTMAEHRMYLPLVSVLGLAVFGLHRWLGARVWIVFAAWALALGGMTVARNRDYRSALALWTDTAEKRPQSERAHTNLGLELQQAGHLDEAAAHYRQAIALQPGHVSAHYDLGLLLLQLGRVTEAVAELEIAVQLAPSHADAQLALGNALARAGRVNDALRHYQASLLIKPAPDVYFNLGVVLADANRWPEAIEALTTALRLQPDLKEAQAQLAKMRTDYGVFLARSGKLPEAQAELLEAVRLRPAYAEAQANLGNVYFMQGRLPEAIARYEEAVRLRPNDARARENLELAREALRTPR